MNKFIVSVSIIVAFLCKLSQSKQAIFDFDGNRKCTGFELALLRWGADFTWFLETQELDMKFEVLKYNNEIPYVYIEVNDKLEMYRLNATVGSKRALQALKKVNAIANEHPIVKNSDFRRDLPGECEKCCAQRLGYCVAIGCSCGRRNLRENLAEAETNEKELRRLNQPNDFEKRLERQGQEVYEQLPIGKKCMPSPKAFKVYVAY